MELQSRPSLNGYAEEQHQGDGGEAGHALQSEQGGKAMNCRCGNPATANGRECSRCYLGRLRGLSWHYAPSKSKGAIDPDKQKKWDSRLEDYAKTRAEGSQPPSTKRRDIELTKKVSDQLGHAVSASDLSTVTGG